MVRTIALIGLTCLMSLSAFAGGKVKSQSAKTTVKKQSKAGASAIGTVQRLGKWAIPPLTKEEITKAKGQLVWRQIPYSQLSKEERHDPNWSVGINPKTGRVDAIMNP